MKEPGGVFQTRRGLKPFTMGFEVANKENYVRPAHHLPISSAKAPPGKNFVWERSKKNKDCGTGILYTPGFSMIRVILFKHLAPCRHFSDSRWIVWVFQVKYLMFFTLRGTTVLMGRYVSRELYQPGIQSRIICNFTYGLL